jgi:sigma-B regulation protein RsbU (phosphoserine phosphatase)
VVLTAVLLSVVIVQFWMTHLVAHSFSVFPGFEIEAGIDSHDYQHVSRIREAGGAVVKWTTDSAKQAGLAVGDTIIAVNSVSLKESPQALFRSFLGRPAGKSIQLRVCKNDSARNMSIILQARDRWLASCGYLGVSTVPVTQQVADSLNVQFSTGVLVTQLSPGSPAELASLLRGDVITRLDGNNIGSNTDFDRIASGLSPGNPVVVELVRNGRLLTIEATPSGRPSEVSYEFYGSRLSGNPLVATWLYYLPRLLFPLLFLITGCLIGWVKTRDSLAFECATVLLVFGLYVTDYTPPCQAAWPDWAWDAWQVINFVVLSLAFPLIIRLFSKFPSPSRLGKVLLRWQWALFLFFVVWAFAQEVFDGLVQVSSLGIPRILEGVFIFFGNTLGRHWYFGTFAGCALLAALLIAQHTETQRHPRTRLAVIEFGMFLGVLAGVLIGLKDLLGSVVPDFMRPVYGYVVWYSPAVLFSAFPITIVYSLFTRRVFGIRFIIRKGLQYLLVSKGALLLGWLLVFAVVQQVLSHGSRISGSVTAVSGLAVAAAFVGSVGLRRLNLKLMRVVDRRFFREALDVRHMLSQLSGELADLRDEEKIHRLVATQALAALHPSRVVLLQKGSGEDDLRSVVVLENGRRLPAAIDSPQVPRLSDAPVLLKPSDVVVQQLEHNGWVAIAPEALNPQAEEEARLLHTGCELLIAIPASTGLLGVMGLGPKLSEEAFSEEDTELLLTVARQAGMALDNAKLVEVAKREARQARELDIARGVQQNLFPRVLPQREGWKFAATCRPARAVGGDYYDLFEIDSARVGFALGDVSGKGLGPALMMSSIHAITQSSLAPMAAEPAHFVEALNEQLHRFTSPGMFATLFVGVLDTSTGILRYVNAGHNPPIVVKRDSSDVSKLTDGGVLVGAFPGMRYTDAAIQVDAGDLLVIYSDGVTEAMNQAGEMFEEERLLNTILKVHGCGSASEVLSSIIDAVDRFAGEAEQADDISVMVVMRDIVP